MKRIATLLLLAVTALFFAAHALESAYPLLAWVRAFSEAAMVGALADWFAVVALFRHPMGIPIPHTAILREKKDEIGATLARFVVGNFLTAEVVASRLERLDLAAICSKWLAANAPAIATRTCEWIPRILGALDDEDVARVIHTHLSAKLADVKAAPLLGNALGLVTAGNRHAVLFGEGLRIAERLVTENREFIEANIRAEVPIPETLQLPALPVRVPLGMVKDQVAAYIATKVVARVQSVLADAASDPAHHLRQEFERRLNEFVEELQTSPDLLAKGEEIKTDLLGNPAVREFAGNAWREIKRRIVEDAASDESEIRRRLVTAIAGVTADIQADAALRGKLNAALRTAVAAFVEQHRDEAKRIIEDTVLSWSADEMTDKLEAEVGRDLQWIRINGTVIGGCVGLVLHAIGKFF